MESKEIMQIDNNYPFEDFIDKNKKLLKELEKKKNRKLRMHTVTFGCQMNEHDSEKIAWILQNLGFESVDTENEADFIIYNTCAVRKSAEDKVLGKLGELKRLKRENDDLIIAICGCMTQIEDTADYIKEKYRHVNIIFGTNNIHKLPEYLYEYLTTKKTVLDLAKKTDVIENIDADRLYDFKAFVNIMYGCNNFCSYCIVPYTRGREVSRDPENIIKEVKDLVENGTKEITLLGQNVNSYGKSLDYDYTFTNLLYDLGEIEGLERLRFMTSHPKDISDDLIEAYGKIDALCNHLHLPVQSGSNRILKQMNRKYTVEDYLEKIEKVRKINKDIAISTDIIVGFPGETEEDFEETLKLVEKVKFDSAFTFLYSIREGTPAAKSDEQVDDKVKHERFERLIKTLNPIAYDINKEYIGKTVKVLVDDISKNNDKVLTGRTSESKIVNFEGDTNLIGQIVNIKINDAKTFTLEGELV